LIKLQEVLRQLCIPFTHFQDRHLPPEFEKDGKTEIYDYGSAALTMVVNTAFKTGNISVLHLKNANDAAKQMEDVKEKMENLYILSHGYSQNPIVDGQVHSAYFAIGSDNYHTADVLGNGRKGKALERMAAMLASTPGPLPSAAEVVVFAVVQVEHITEVSN